YATTETLVAPHADGSGAVFTGRHRYPPQTVLARPRSRGHSRTVGSGVVTGGVAASTPVRAGQALYPALIPPAAQQPPGDVWAAGAGAVPVTYAKIQAAQRKDHGRWRKDRLVPRPPPVSSAGG